MNFWRIAVGLSSLLLSVSTYQANAQCNPSIGASQLSGCAPLNIQFTDQTPVTQGQSRVWNFGNGQTSTANVFLATFPAGVTGDTSYVVALTVTCLNGATVTVRDTVNVFAKPNVDFVASDTLVCAISDTVCFTNLSDQGNGYSYNWAFGDLNFSTQINPCHVYSVSDTNTVRLTVTNDKGCVGELIKTDYIQVIGAPSPDFTVINQTGCNPLSVSFQNTTDTTQDNIAAWHWDYGNGQTSSSFSPAAQVYTQADTILVALTATNNLGCFNTTFQAVIIKATPVAQLSFQKQVCANEQVGFTFTGEALSAATFNWQFGNAQNPTASGVGPHNVIWNQAGIQLVNLRVSQNGCTDSIVDSLLVYPLPSVNLSTQFGNDTACSGDSLVLSAVPQLYPNYTFTANAATIVSGQSAAVVVNNLVNGTVYNVQVTDMNGCVNTAANPINLNVKPSPSVTIASSLLSDSLCTGSGVSFTALPSGLDEYIFRNNFFDQQQGPSNAFAIGGLTADARIDVLGFLDGCSAASSPISLTVFDSVRAAIPFCDSASSSSITFGWDSIAGVALYEVSINNGPFIAPNASFNHTLTGLAPSAAASIRVRTTGNAICADVFLSDTLQCFANPCDPIEFSITAPAKVCQGDSVSVSVDVTSTPNYGVDFGAGFTQAVDLVFFPSADTSFIVQVFDSTQLLCPAKPQLLVVDVVSLPTISISPGLPASVCENESYIIQANPIGYSSYQFYNKFMLLQQGLNPFYSINDFSTGDSIYAVGIKEGCSVNSANAIAPAVQLKSGTPQVFCKNSSVGSVTFEWNAVANTNGFEVSINGGTFITPSSGALGNLHTINGLAQGTAVNLSVRSLNNSPCQAAQVSLPATCVSANCTPFNFSLPPTIQACEEDSVVIAVQNISVSNYSLWFNGAIASNTTTGGIVTRDTVVYVSVIDSAQLLCPSVNKLVQIEVSEVPQIVLQWLSNDTICQGEALQVQASPSGLDEYRFLSGFNPLQSNANPIFSTSALQQGDSLRVIAFNNGCGSDGSNVLKPTIKQPLARPQVNCGNTTLSSIEFVWDTVASALGYAIAVQGASFQTPSSGQFGLLHSVTGLSPNDVLYALVVALGDGSCGNSVVSDTVFCTAQPCTQINFLAPANTIACIGDTLNFEVEGITTNNFDLSINGQSQLNDSTFSIVALQTDTISLQLTDSNQAVCPAVTKSFVLLLNQTPNVTLSSGVANDSICQGDAVTFTVSPAGLDEYWFYVDALLVQQGANHQVQLSSLEATDSVFVLARDAQCAIEQTNVIQMNIETPLEAPQVNCGNSNDTSIQFTWNAINGAIGYAVSVNGSTFITPSSGLLGTVHQLNGLNPGNIASLTVQAIGSGLCGSSEIAAAKTCVAVPCTAYSFSLTPAQQACEGEVVVVEASGISLANYSLLVNGSVSASSQVSLIATSDTTLSFELQDLDQPNCPSYRLNTSVLVTPTPVIQLNNLSADSICEGTLAQFAALPAIFDSYSFSINYQPIQFGNTNILSTTAIQNGDFISAFATENGCDGAAVQVFVPYVADAPQLPQLNCLQSTNTSITVGWTVSASAAGYELVVDGVNVGNPSQGVFALQETIGGLNPGQNVSITVRALGADPCRGFVTSNTVTCSAIPCAPVSFNLSADTAFCAGGQASFGISSLQPSNASLTFNGIAATAALQQFIAQNDTIITVSAINASQPACPPFTLNFEVIAYPFPEISLSMLPDEDTLCENVLSTVSSSNLAYQQYLFFNQGNIIQQGANPILINANPSSNDSIYAVAVNNGCTSAISNAIVYDVSPAAQQPLVSCGASTDSTVIINWQADSLIDTYALSINGGAALPIATGTFQLAGLNAGDTVFYTLNAIQTGVCLPSTLVSSGFCVATNCSGVNVIVPPLQTVCAGDTVLLQLSNATTANFSYSINGLGNFTTTQLPLIIGSDSILTIQFSDANQPQCPSLSRTVMVDVVDLPVVNLSANVANNAICSGQTVTFIASPAGFDQYTFSIGFSQAQNGAGNSFSANTLQNGDAISVVATEKGCSGASSAPIVMQVDQPLQSPQVNCGGSTTSSVSFVWQSVAGASGYRISVNGGNYVVPSAGVLGLSHVISGLNAGDSVNVRVIALGNNACGNSAPSNLITCFAINCAPTQFAITPDTAICAGQSATVEVSNISTPNFTLQFNGVNAIGNSITLTPVATTTVTARLVDNNQPNCPAFVLSRQITVNPLPNVQLFTPNGSDTLCAGALVSLNAAPTNYDNYAFEVNGNVVQSGPNPVLNYQVDSASSISVTATELGCAASSALLSVKVAPAISLSLSTNLAGAGLCLNDTLAITALPSGLNSYRFFDLATNTTISQGVANTTQTASLLSNNQITATAIDRFGCFVSAADTFSIPIFSLPQITAVLAADSICRGTAAQLDLTPTGLNFEITLPNGSAVSTAQSSISINGIDSSGVLMVMGTDANGCKSNIIGNLSIGVKPLPQSVLLEDSIRTCVNEEISLQVFDSLYPSTTYQWSTGESGSGIAVIATTDQALWVTGQLNGCNGDTLFATISVNNQFPTANAGEDQTICITDSAQLSASGGSSYLWLVNDALNNDSIANPKASPITTTTYVVQVTEDACSSTDEVTITVDRCLTDLTGPVPQVITPNGDATNDAWIIPDVDYFTQNKLQIFNRWGALVFEAAPYLNTWQGTTQDNEPLPDATYFYTLDLGNGNEVIKGFIMIQR